ncbi:MAG: Ig-like domain-containing protein [Ruminococcaceae bacterium]|nr:Ig-like domain-containing protein [Oscillospiraceae bacterium]
MKTKRILSFLLVFVMLVGIIPVTAFATEEAPEGTLEIMDPRTGQFVDSIEVIPGVTQSVNVYFVDVSGMRTKLLPNQVSWSVADSELATVSNNRIEAMMEGVTTITAMYNDASGNSYSKVIDLYIGDGYTDIRIFDEDMNDITFTDITLKVGDTMSISGKVTKKFGETVVEVTDNLFWYSDSSAVSFNNGVITAEMAGNAMVNLCYTANDGSSLEASIFVTVEEAGKETFISTVNVKDVSLTGAGQLPDYDATVEGEGYSLFTPDNLDISKYIKNGIAWYDVTFGMYLIPDVDVLTEDHVYSVRSFIIAEDGYYLDLYSTKFLFNGVERSNLGSVDGYDKTKAVIMYTNKVFTVDDIKNEKVESVGFELDQPVLGRHPDFTAESNFPNESYVDTPAYTSGYTNGIMWYDNTAKKILTEDDVFEDGHSYSLSLVFIAKDGREFVLNTDGTPKLSVISNYLYDFTSLKLGNLDSKEFVLVTCNNITPYKEHTVTVTNGNAVDENNYIVRKAAYGDIVKLIAFPPYPYYTFNGWKCISGDMYFFEPENSTTEFIMCDSDVQVEAVFENENTVIEDVEIIGIDTPVIGRPADFEATVPADVNYYIGIPSEDYYFFHNGIRWYDRTANCDLLPGDCFVEGHEYDLFVGVIAEDGYVLAVNEVGQSAVDIYFSGFDPYLVSFATEPKYEYLCVRTPLEAPVTPAPLFAVNIENGKAYNKAGEEISYAAAGDIVTVKYEDSLGLGRAFVNWVSDDVTFNNVYASEIRFEMPDRDVTVTAVAKNIEILYIPTRLDEPVVGRHPDYDMFIHSNYGFTADAPEEFIYFYNGIAWVDATEDRYMTTDEVFVEGHEYYPIIGLKAKEGYSFAQPASRIDIYNNLTDEVLAGGFHNHSEEDFLCVSFGDINDLWTITPKPQYTITVINGESFTAAGFDTVTAAAGETIILQAIDESGVQTFKKWKAVSGCSDSNFASTDYARTTFTMPASDIVVEAVYQPCAIYSINLEISDYNCYNTAENLNFKVNTAGVCTVRDTNTDLEYTIYDDKMGAPNKPYYGALVAGRFWLRAELEADNGYSFEGLGSYMIELHLDDKIYYASIQEQSADKLVVYFDLGEVPSPDVYSVYTDKAIASLYGQDCYYAPVGAKVYLYPVAPSDEAIFAGWEVEFGNVEILTDEDGISYFIMPEESVYVKAKFNGPITTIYIGSFDRPVAGEKPDYDLSIESEGCIFFDNGNWAAVNGVIWLIDHDNGISEKLDPETAVFEPGKTYSVSILLEAEEGYWFSQNEEGGYFVDAYLDGTYCWTAQIGLDSYKYMSISCQFTIPAVYNITVEGGNAYAPRSNNTPTGNGVPVTSAQEGEYINVVADEAPLGRVFDHWEIVSGSVKIAEEDLLYDNFSFLMPDEDVVIRAVFVYTHGDPEVAVEGYNVQVSHASDLTYIRYALGEYKTAGEIKNAADCVTLNSKKIAEYTANDVCTINMADGGLYSFWLKTADGREYILYADLTTMEQYLTSYGVTLTVHNLYGVRDFFIAKGDYDTYADIKANYIVNVTSAKINGAHDYSYILSEPGFYTVYIRYTDSTRPATVLKTTLEVTEPYFVENGLQLTVGNLDDIKVIRTAYGEYTTAGEVKRAAGARAFSGKDVLKGKDEYTIQYRENGIVTVAVVYNNGYTVMYYYDVQQKVPEFTQKGNVISFFELDDLKLIRYAEGEYVTSKEIKNAKGSKVVKPEDLNYGFFQIELNPGTYTFCVQYNEESYNYYIVTIE